MGDGEGKSVMFTCGINFQRLDCDSAQLSAAITCLLRNN